MAWIVSPLLHYGLLGAGLVVGLYLFISVKRDLRAAEARLKKRVGSLEAVLEKLLADLGQVRGAVREAEERAGILVPPTPPRSGLNLGKRAQVLRLFRRGEPPEQIAATLALPQAEVDLLLKVHRLVLQLPGH